MSAMSWPCLKIETVPVDCEMQKETASVFTVMPAAASWRVPRPWGKGTSGLARGMRYRPALEDHAVASNDERAVDGRELLDRLLQALIEDVSVFLRVAVEGVDDELAALGQHAVAIAEHEKRPDLPALATFQPQLAAESQHALEDGRADVGRERVGRLDAEQFILGAEVEHDQRVDHPGAVDAGQPQHAVAGMNQALDGRDQRGELDLPGAGHRDVGDARPGSTGRPSRREAGSSTVSRSGSPENRRPGAGRLVRNPPRPRRPRAGRPSRRSLGRSHERAGRSCASGSSRRFHPLRVGCECR